MPLKTFVKVGRITNLSEARYCAGMGVDLLGFCTIKGKESYLAPSQFQEIRGWITGPQIVAEIYGLQSQAELESILSDYKPDYLEMGAQELELLADVPLPFILSSDGAVVSPDPRKTPGYLLLKDLAINALPYPVLIEVQSLMDVQRVLNSPNTSGIAMNGGPEIRPGLKEYEVLAEILELLDTD
jgi:phosphoribosylanthranilate isomerase